MGAADSGCSRCAEGMLSYRILSTRGGGAPAVLQGATSAGLVAVGQGGAIVNSTR
jgi:hypothetical protein